MTHLTFIAIVILWTLPFGTMPATARDGATKAASGTTDWSAARRSKRPPRSVAQGYPGRIACPRGGCRPVPAGCGVTSERDLDGNPTGFEIIVCPPR
jgi:hypothetical protein